MESFKYSGEAATGDGAWRVVFAPGPSRRADAWVIGVAAAALVALLVAAMPLLAKVLVTGALGGATIRAARRHAWQEGPGAVRRFVVDLSGRVEVEESDGRAVTGRLIEGSFVAPWLTIVRWQPDGARFARTLAVFPDAIDAEKFRRLRVLLRWR